MNKFIKCFIYIVIIIVIINFGSKILYNIKYKKMNDIDNIHEPIQTSTSGEIYKNIDNTEVKIEFLAKYIITGRVILTNYYQPDTIENTLSPMDIGLAWGKLAKNFNRDTVNWSLSNRYLSWNSSDFEWIKKVGGVSTIKRSFSNNHIIPDSIENQKLIYTVKRDDYIKLEGYLVKVTYDMPNGGKYKWKSIFC